MFYCRGKITTKFYHLRIDLSISSMCFVCFLISFRPFNGFSSIVNDFALEHHRKMCECEPKGHLINGGVYSIEIVIEVIENETYAIHCLFNLLQFLLHKCCTLSFSITKRRQIAICFSIKNCAEIRSINRNESHIFVFPFKMCSLVLILNASI